MYQNSITDMGIKFVEQIAKGYVGLTAQLLKLYFDQLRALQEQLAAVGVVLPLTWPVDLARSITAPHNTTEQKIDALQAQIEQLTKTISQLEGHTHTVVWNRSKPRQDAIVN
ncbi:MAG: hypothetical protein H6632_08130 [Anaerolineales bacterium]|nr:hypothetical protein [Anaerolineales bacterium]